MCPYCQFPFNILLPSHDIKYTKEDIRKIISQIAKERGLSTSIEILFRKLIHSFKLMIGFNLIKMSKFNGYLANSVFKLVSEMWENQAIQ